MKSSKWARIIFGINAIIMLAIGIAFVFAQEFFPFHGDVIGQDWAHVDERSKILYLGMMRTEGAGYLAAATAMIFLLVFPLRRHSPKWAIWAITSIGLIEHLPTLLATYHVAQVSAASPPWQATLVCMLSLLLAAFLSRQPSAPA